MVEILDLVWNLLKVFLCWGFLCVKGRKSIYLVVGSVKIENWVNIKLCEGF